MEIQQIKAFLAVAKTGNFSRAAAILFRTQPSVTVAIRRLEKELGAKLFERHGRKTIPTGAGEKLARSAGVLMGQWDGLKDSLDDNRRGRVRIGSGEAVLLYLLPRVMDKFRKEFPEVKVAFHSQRAEATLEMLKTGELDFGIRSMERTPSWALFRPALTYERMAIAEKGHPIGKVKKLSLEELARHPLLLGDEMSTTRRIVEGKLAEAGLTWEIGMEAGGWEVVKTYAGRGSGVAIVPSICLIPEDKKRLTVLAAGHLFGHDRYGIVTRKGAALSMASKRLIQIVDPGYPAEGRD